MVAPIYQTPLYNEVDLEQALVAIETVPGVATPPRFRLPWRLDLTGTRASQDIRNATGGRDRRTAFTQGGLDVAGTMGGDQANGAVAFEDMQLLDDLSIGGTATNASTPDGASPPSFLAVARPSAAANDLARMSAETGFRHGVKQGKMIFVNEETITIDPDSNASWTVSAAVLAKGYGDKPVTTKRPATSATTTELTDSAATLTIGAWVGGIVQVGTSPATYQEREIVANTATTITVFPPFATAPLATTPYQLIPDFTPGVVNYDRELIPAAGTELYLDDRAGVIGTTRSLQRFISATVTIQNNQKTKRFAENVDEVSDRVGVGERLVTVQLTMEADRKRMDEEMTEFQRADRRETDVNWRRMRLRQLGPEVSPGVPREAIIDLQRLHWLSYTVADRNGNRTGTLAGQAYLDPLNLYIIERRTRNSLAAIPA